MKTSLAIVLLFVSSLVFSQKKDTETLLKNLKNADEHFFECHSDYWKILSGGIAVVPSLLDKLEDTTETNVTHPCKKGKMKVGDLAFLMLEEIIMIPTFKVTGVQFDLIDQEGCQVGVYAYLERERKKFTLQLKAYYKTNEGRFRFTAFDKRQMSACRKANGIRGYYSAY